MDAHVVWVFHTSFFCLCDMRCFLYTADFNRAIICLKRIVIISTRLLIYFTKLAHGMIFLHNFLIYVICSVFCFLPLLRLYLMFLFWLLLKDLLMSFIFCSKFIAISMPVSTISPLHTLPLFLPKEFNRIANLNLLSSSFALSFWRGNFWMLLLGCASLNYSMKAIVFRFVCWHLWFTESLHLFDSELDSRLEAWHQVTPPWKSSWSVIPSVPRFQLPFDGNNLIHD